MTTTTPLSGRVLVVAGSDSGGGAGIQADIKTITALGGYASCAITALTVQDTNMVHDILPVAPKFLAHQIRVVLEDIGADIVKTGMLHTRAIMEHSCEALDDALPVVCDPVMVAKGGARLLEQDALSALRALMVPRAHLLTPNLAEAGLLVGFAVETETQQQRAAEALLKQGAHAVLVKGGHGKEATISDVLMTQSGEHVLRNPRLKTYATHGTGCTLASAIATELAFATPLPDAVQHAIAYVRAAMQAAPRLGSGHAPLAHAYKAKAERG